MIREYAEAAEIATANCFACAIWLNPDSCREKTAAMSTVKIVVNRALSRLVGVPLWDRWRFLGCSMEVLDLGAKILKTSRDGETFEHGEYSFHIDCPWRLIGPKGIVAGIVDSHFPPDERSPKDWDAYKEESRSDMLMNAWLKKWPKRPPRVLSVQADDVGGFRLLLEKDFVYEVFPADSSPRQGGHWRLIQRAAGETRHFVVSGTEAAWGQWAANA